MICSSIVKLAIIALVSSSQSVNAQDLLEYNACAKITAGKPSQNVPYLSIPVGASVNFNKEGFVPCGDFKKLQSGAVSATCGGRTFLLNESGSDFQFVIDKLGARAPIETNLHGSSKFCVEASRYPGLRERLISYSGPNYWVNAREAFLSVRKVQGSGRVLGGIPLEIVLEIPYNLEVMRPGYSF
jgi:hypothetical protein